MGHQNTNIKPGKGLLEQIKNNKQVKYEPLNLESFKHILLKFNLEALRNQVKESLEELVLQNKIDSEKEESLLKMINSNDEESIILAKEIIKLKRNDK